jgi:putative component of membrane protein insertase Oxa1/YidC/SpoIIIJ protein YidD
MALFSFKPIRKDHQRYLPKRVFCLLIVTIAIVSCRSEPEIRPESDDGSGLNPFAAVVRFYRGPLNHLSAVRSGECPMYPSDSEYSLQSFKSHGMLLGWVMSVDRLMRCGRDETRLSPTVRVKGKLKTYDPLNQNDFWWYDSNPDKPGTNRNLP